MNPVIHFEMSYEDRDRMADFYSKAFGWQANKLGPEMGNYVVVYTGPTDEKTHMVKQPGMINGGLYKATKDVHGTAVTIAVDDIYEAMNKVKEAGGKVIGASQGPDKPDDIPGVGLYIGIEDTEGNRVSMLQPTKKI